jgi:hypothetical protein
MRKETLLPVSLILLAVLILAVQAKAGNFSQNSDPISSIAEWQSYTNGLEPGSSGTFAPDSGFTLFHVDEIEYLINGDGVPGSTISVTFTATYTDGSTSTSGSVGFFNGEVDTIVPTMFPYTYWVPLEPKSPNGRRMKSLSYLVGDPVGHPTLIMQAHGFETK